MYAYTLKTISNQSLKNMAKAFQLLLTISTLLTAPFFSMLYETLEYFALPAMFKLFFYYWQLKFFNVVVLFPKRNKLAIFPLFHYVILQTKYFQSHWNTYTIKKKAISLMNICTTSQFGKKIIHLFLFLLDNFFLV